MWKSLNFGVFLFLMISCGKKSRYKLQRNDIFQSWYSLDVDRLTQLSFLDVKSDQKSSCCTIVKSWN
jgi:hypothetical protein